MSPRNCGKQSSRKNCDYVSADEFDSKATDKKVCVSIHGTDEANSTIRSSVRCDSKCVVNLFLSILLGEEIRLRKAEILG